MICYTAILDPTVIPTVIDTVIPTVIDTFRYRFVWLCSTDNRRGVQLCVQIDNDILVNHAAISLYPRFRKAHMRNCITARI